MKRLLLLMALAGLLVLASGALAQDEGGFQSGDKAAKSSGGFVGPNASSITVAEALKLEDDAWVTLTGKIEKQLGHEKYQFSDATGNITLDISDRLWKGQTITPEDTLEVFGEVDKDKKGLEIDVKKIVKK